MATLEACRPPRDQVGRHLRVEIEIRRFGCILTPSAEIARRGEFATEGSLGRGNAWQRAADPKGGAADDLAEKRYCPAPIAM